MLNVPVSLTFGKSLLYDMNYAGMEDLQLLKLLQEEDRLAFAEIYNRYWKRIYTMALTYLKSSEAAQDAVQDVFFKLWTGRESLSQVRDFRPYLFVSARNMVISSLRNKIFHVYLDEEEEIEEEILLPERQFSYKESVDLLHKAVDQLPNQQRKAYKLSRNEGMTYEEIAEVMGISRLTVRTHISKAIQFIRKYLTGNAINFIYLLTFWF